MTTGELRPGLYVAACGRCGTRYASHAPHVIDRCRRCKHRDDELSVTRDELSAIRARLDAIYAYDIATAARAERAEAEVTRLREALAWYADEANYRGFDRCNVCIDRGDRARTALAAASEPGPGQAGDPLALARQRACASMAERVATVEGLRPGEGDVPTPQAGEGEAG